MLSLLLFAGAAAACINRAFMLPSEFDAGMDSSTRRTSRARVQFNFNFNELLVAEELFFCSKHPQLHAVQLAAFQAPATEYPSEGEEPTYVELTRGSLVSPE